MSKTKFHNQKPTVWLPEAYETDSIYTGHRPQPKEKLHLETSNTWAHIYPQAYFKTSLVWQHHGSGHLANPSPGLALPSPWCTFNDAHSTLENPDGMVPSALLLLLHKNTRSIKSWYIFQTMGSSCIYYEGWALWCLAQWKFLATMW